MSESTNSPSCVAEVQGLYGPVSLSEHVFQKIWNRGDFRAENLRTHSGKRLEILSRGKWNKLAGPDFIGAELLIDGKRMIGDIEFHFYAEDWHAHAHEKNPDYGNVILHVLLFPPQNNFPKTNARGNAMETFLLLPHLNVDVEEYASAEAMSALEGRTESDGLLEFLLEKPLPDRLRLLSDGARERYDQKVRFMRRRLEKTPWDKLLHEVVLETLGLQRNRPAMSRLALKFSPSAMLLSGAEPLFRSATGTWKLSGVRPANHPIARLRQYLALLEKNPSWTRQLQELSDTFSAIADMEFQMNGKLFRTLRKIPAFHKTLAEKTFAGTIGGTRFETLICDAILPIIAANSGADLFPLWYHWFIGDAPANVAKILRSTDLASRERPLCNGAFQGLLQLTLTRKPTTPNRL